MRLQSFRNRMHRLYLDDAGPASHKNKDDPILGGVSATSKHECRSRRGAAACGRFP